MDLSIDGLRRDYRRRISDNDHQMVFVVWAERKGRKNSGKREGERERMELESWWRRRDGRDSRRGGRRKERMNEMVI